MIYDFKNNGDVTQTIEVLDHLAFMEGMKKYTLDLTYATMELEGYSKEQTDEAYKQLYGMTTEEYVSKEMDQMDLEEFFSAFTDDGVYYVTENKIWMAPSWLNEFESSDYTLEDGVLIIDEDTLVEDGEPLEWTRVEE